MDDIQDDWSFHQHGPELLAGSYGEVYSSLLLQVVKVEFVLVIVIYRLPTYACLLPALGFFT